MAYAGNNRVGIGLRTGVEAPRGALLFTRPPGGPVAVFDSRVDELEGGALAIGRFRVASFIRVAHPVGGVAILVAQQECLRRIAEATLPGSENPLNSVMLLCQLRLPGQHEVFARADGCAVGELKVDSPGKGPAAEVDHLAGAVQELDILTARIICRVIHDLVDDDVCARAVKVGAARGGLLEDQAVVGAIGEAAA